MNKVKLYLNFEIKILIQIKTNLKIKTVILSLK